MSAPNRPPLPSLDIPPGLDPLYANVVRISHTPAELVFDFGCLLPGEPKVRVISRLLMSPVGAKLFFRALGDNIARFEATFGEISLPGEGSLASQLFRSTPPSETPPEAEK